MLRFLSTPARVIASWALSRGLVLAAFALVPTERDVSGDYLHYLRSFRELDHGGNWAHTLPEYPLPVALVLRLLYLVGDGTQARFNAALVITLLAGDGAFTWWLARRETRDDRSPVGALAWVLLGLLSGPLLYFRFDTVTALLAAVALATNVRTPARSGVTAAAGFLVKLWPAALVPVLAVGTRKPWRLLLASAATTAAVVAGCALAFGWERTVSPLTWQSKRGIQVESLVATPLMVARYAAPEGHPVAFTFGAFEITGAGVAAARAAAALATALAALLVLHLLVRCLRNPLVDGPDAALWIGLAAIILIIATDKTFSPQYLLWFAAPVCVALAVTQRRRAVQRLTAVLVGCLLLTHADYPWTNADLLTAHPSGLATTTLVLRNLVVALLAGMTTYEAYRATRPAHGSSSTLMARRSSIAA